ncbi:MAG: 1-acyl-sn-glycerol-3-phosphate acyltransferase [Bacteroidales bacterium]|nr:1-acyl-sn-glycerol-3-phosphate acyltransferase [Bacteroidales bacterium]
MLKDRTDYLLDIDEILGPKMAAKMPGFVKRFLKKRLHFKEINDCIMKAEHYAGAGFFDEALNYIGITYRTRGEENIDVSKKYIFVCNHPLGGPEALIIGSVFTRIYGDGFKVPANQILYNMKPLQEFFVPVKVSASRQNRDIADRFTAMFESDSQILVFPAGLCARTFKGVITEMPWKKMFVTQARKYERDVVPVHISGHNSKWYFFLSWLSRTLKLKFNIGMLFLVDELFNQAGKEFVITFGKPVPYETFDSSRTDMQWAEEMKNTVKKLSLDNGCTPNM